MLILIINLIKKCANMIELLKLKDIIYNRNLVYHGYNFIFTIYYQCIQIIVEVFESSKKSNQKYIILEYY